ncbi:MAG TPA: hypothetical protein VJ436_08615 [Anaerolineales bacterium]|nr:hypothetical protein [Anaerolineales bacterium]
MEEREERFYGEVKRTLVTLIHQVWERCIELLGEAALVEHEGYAGGWEHILRQFRVYSSNKNVGSA